MTKEKDTQIGFRCSKELKNKVEHYAEQLNTSKAKLVRAITEDFIKELEEGDSDIREMQGKLIGLKRPLVHNRIEVEKLKEKVNELDKSQQKILGKLKLGKEHRLKKGEEYD